MGKGGAVGANLKQDDVASSVQREISSLKMKNQELNSVVMKVWLSDLLLAAPLELALPR